MFNRKGEISTIIILGTLVVMGVAALMSSTVNNQKQITNARAAGVSCSNNPVPPPDGGYTWVANCSSSCTTNANCPQNTSDPSNVNPSTSNWCYEFAEGARCMQLQKGTGSITPLNNNPTPAGSNNSTNTGGTICSVATGCGGACNSNMNQGCGYGGCRAWEDCVNNTCIDTTNLGTQSAGENACNGLATADSPQNKPSTTTTGGTDSGTKTNPTAPTSVTQTPNPTSSTSGSNPNSKQTPTILPTVPSTPSGNQPVATNPSSASTSCGIGQKWCPDINKCALEYLPCPTPTSPDKQLNTVEGVPAKPTPTSSRVQVTLGVPPNTPTPTRSAGGTTSTKKVKIYQTIESRVCTGNVTIDNGCIDLYGYYNL